MTPQRPALAEVLAALDAPTDGLTVGDGPAMSPDEAVEALATARLWPWEPGDDPTRWWCPGCAGNGWLIPTPGFGGAPCPQCHGDDTRPPSLAALVAVASLGAPQLARYVGLAGEIARTVTWAPALRALAVGEDATPKPTGVLLVGLDASRIVLAVEAL